MALDRHTIASLEGSHYQVMGDKGEISKQTHSNDARRQSLPTWRVWASAVTKADFFVCNLMLLKLAVMGKWSNESSVKGEKGERINGYSMALLHSIVIPSSFIVLLSTFSHSPDGRLQVVNSIAENRPVCEGDKSCINKTNSPEQTTFFYVI